MDKNTVLFIIISVVIMIFGMILLPAIFVKPPQETTSTSVSLANESSQDAVTQAAASAPVTNETTQVIEGLFDSTLARDAFIPVVDAKSDIATRDYTIENDLVRVVISSKGARATSIQMKKHLEKATKGTPPVEMIIPSENGGIVSSFGGINGQDMLDTFILESSSLDKSTISFYKDYFRNDKPGIPIRVTKKYTIIPGEYVFQLDIGFSVNATEVIPSALGEFTYTLGIRPQIGPSSSKIGNYQDFRTFAYHDGNKKKVPKNNATGITKLDEAVKWAAITGKYFSFIMIPGAADYQVSFVSKLGEDLPQSNLNFSRRLIQSSKNIDTYRFYVGPKLTVALDKFDRSADNNAKLAGMKFASLIDFDVLGWLSEIMKQIMQVFYYVVPNWGVTIILLTILVKVALFPLSKKSAESTARMQELNPKLEAIKAKYQDNPQKLNEETAALYQKEKINPLAGCLPMLIQLPFFFAMYSLFNNHFDLRGAIFIPGWINDLSAPESVWNFGSFVIPLVNINDLRLLPIIYVATQLITSMVTPSGAQTNPQMKMMMYAMPIMFFFILYNVPSGLLVYWIFQNILGILQQLLVNKMVHDKKVLATVQSKK